MTVSDVSDKILDENFGLDLMHSEEINSSPSDISVKSVLTHYGVKGMKWGIRKEYESHPRKKVGSRNQNYQSSKKVKSNSNLKRNIAIGTAAVGIALAAYGTYRFTKGVRDDRLKMAMEDGKKLAELMKLSDRNGSLKDIYGDRPDSYYNKYVDEKIAEAKTESFKKAYEKVKPVRKQAKKAVTKHKENVKKVTAVIKRMKKKDDWFGTGPSTIAHYAKVDPDVLKELKIEIKDGIIYQKGKRIN